MVSEQINVLTINYGGDQLIILDDAGIYNDLMRLTANEVYVNDTDNVQHLACLYNCHYDDYHPVDGASWWLYRYDRTGLPNEFR